MINLSVIQGLPHGKGGGGIAEKLSGSGEDRIQLLAIVDGVCTAAQLSVISDLGVCICSELFVELYSYFCEEEVELNLVKEAALDIPQIGYMGWDIAFTPDGPVIVEGKYDRLKILTVAEAKVITTDGFGIFSKAEKAEFLRRLAEKNGVIVITDCDGAGLIIRNHLKNIIHSCII